MEQLCVNGKDYTILKILGKGKGGYSYLATIDDKKVVLKQIHHEPCSYYQFGNKIEAEQNDYHRLKNIGIAMPKMIEIDGKTAYEMVLNDELPPDCIEQVKHMCSLLYPANTNIDYFPTNFVLQDKILYYIDYECNDYMEEWNFENWGIKYWSKTPEFLQYVSEHERTCF